MGNFHHLKTTSLKSDKVESLPESDYAVLVDGNLVQFEYKSEETKKRENVKIKNGIWKITKSMMGLQLEATSFVNDKIIEDYVKTAEIEECIDVFFENIHLYKEEFGIEVARRNLLIYGPAGTGKSTGIAKICNKYVKLADTAVIVWHTAVWPPHEIKDLIQRLEYDGVQKLIVVAEDLGGVESEDHRMASDSSLLSLLDNSEKTFTLPTCIIATTNYPQMFMKNISNRPGRFDDKIQVSWPDAEARAKFLTFFSRGTCKPEDLELIKDKKFKEFSPAHIKEVYVRSRLKKKEISFVLNQMADEANFANNGFNKREAMGLT